MDLPAVLISAVGASGSACCLPVHPQQRRVQRRRRRRLLGRAAEQARDVVQRVRGDVAEDEEEDAELERDAAGVLVERALRLDAARAEPLLSPERLGREDRLIDDIEQ